MTKCDTTREWLVEGGRRMPAEPLEGHLDECAACAEFAARLRTAEEILGRRLRVEPGPEFAARVVASLPRGQEVLGWAALRLMPAAVALALALTGWCLLATPSPSVLLEESASDDPLVWVIAEGEEEG